MSTRENQIRQSDCPGEDVFWRLIEAVQNDLTDRDNLFQGALLRFPAVPVLGGIFRTRKGVYEAVFTDPANPEDPELPRWRRLSDNTLHEAGDSIPTTL